MLEIIPGPGDDGPPGDHVEGRGDGVGGGGLVRGVHLLGREGSRLLIPRLLFTCAEKETFLKNAHVKGRKEIIPQ